jgi:hypothetical protein
MKKIDELTPEQEALIPIVRQEWIDFSLGGDTSVNEPEAKEGLSWLYKEANLEPPEHVVVMDSPIACQFAANLMKHYCENIEVYEKEAREEVMKEIAAEAKKAAKEAKAAKKASAKSKSEPSA